MWPDRVSNPGPLTYESGALPTTLRGPACCCVVLVLLLLQRSGISVTRGGRQAVLQVKSGKRDNLGIIFLITPLKCTLRPVIRTVSSRRF